MAIVEGPVAAALPRRSIWPAIHPRLLELIRAHRSTLSSSTAAAWRSAWPPPSTSWPARSWPARTTARSPASSGRRSRTPSRPAGCPRWSPRRPWSWGSTWGPSTWWCRSRPRPAWPAACSASAGPATSADAVSRGVIFPKYRGDLLATAAVTRAMTLGQVEATRIPANPLDVLAQQLVAICAAGERTVDDLFELVRRAAPVRPPAARAVRGRAGHAVRAAIPPTSSRSCGRGWSGTACSGARAGPRGRGAPGRRERGDHPGPRAVRRLPGRRAETGARTGRVGELDEEMVFESREGEVFVLGASSWRIVEIGRDRVLVAPGARASPGKMPFWKGDRPPRPVELGRAIGRAHPGAARRRPGRRPGAARRDEHALDRRAAARTCSPTCRTRSEATGVLPTTARWSLERTRDEMGDWRLCLLSPWGGRVHAPVVAGAARPGLRGRRRRRGGDDLERRRHRGPPARPRAPARRGRAAAGARGDRGACVIGRAGRDRAVRRALPRGGGPRAAAAAPPARPALAALDAAQARRTTCWRWPPRYGSFPIILETYRECLQDVFDLPALVDLARSVRAASCGWSPWTQPRPRRSRPRCCSATSPTTSTTATRRSPSGAPRPWRWTSASSASCSARPSCASCSIRRPSAELELRCRASPPTQRLRAPTACTTCCCASAT